MALGISEVTSPRPAQTAGGEANSHETALYQTPNDLQWKKCLPDYGRVTVPSTVPCR